MEKDYKYTQKEEDFCRAYIETGVQIEAYSAAYKTDNYKPITIATNASKLFKKPKIQARIKELQDEVAERSVITIAELVEDLANMVRFDPADMYDELGDLKSIHEMPKPVRQMMASLDIQSMFQGKGDNVKHVGYIKKVKLIDKLGAIEKLMKHLGAYEKHNKQKPGSVVVFEIPNNGRK